MSSLIRTIMPQCWRVVISSPEREPSSRPTLIGSTRVSTIRASLCRVNRRAGTRRIHGRIHMRTCLLALATSTAVLLSGGTAVVAQQGPGGRMMQGDQQEMQRRQMMQQQQRVPKPAT